MLCTVVQGCQVLAVEVRRKLGTKQLTMVTERGTQTNKTVSLASWPHHLALAAIANNLENQCISALLHKALNGSYDVWGSAICRLTVLPALPSFCRCSAVSRMESCSTLEIMRWGRTVLPFCWEVSRPSLSAASRLCQKCFTAVWNTRLFAWQRQSEWVCFCADFRHRKQERTDSIGHRQRSWTCKRYKDRPDLQL